MTYVIGVSSGIFGAVPEEQKIEYAGLSRKAAYCIYKGVKFVQLDLESISEFKEDKLKEKLNRIAGLDVTFGIHSETAAFGVEVAEPDSAIELDYSYGHERLGVVIDRSGWLGAKYVLIHSSESKPFRMLGRVMQPAILVDVWGRSLRYFIEKEEDWILDWMLGNGEFKDKPNGKFMWTDIIGRDFDEYVKMRIADRTEEWRLLRFPIKKTKKEIERMKKTPEIEAIRRGLKKERPELSDEEIEKEIEKLIKKEYEEEKEIWKEKEPPKELKDKWEQRIKDDLKRHFLGFVESRSLHYGPERYAYYIIAKWMERNDDPLWQNIIDATVKYFAATESPPTTPEEWIKKRGIEKIDGKWSIDNKEFREEYRLWVPAVSAKYIWGHLMQDKCPTGEQLPSLRNKLKVKKDGKEYIMPLVLESPMAHRGVEEWLRLPNPLQFYYLAKQVNEDAGFDCMAVAMDFEHMLSLRLDPKKVIELLPEDGGKFVRVLHVGYPSPLAPAHIPIPIGAEETEYLYELMYALRQKGFGKDENEYFIIFERGGGKDPIKKSIHNLRWIVSYLEKDVHPKELPKEFYGVPRSPVVARQRLKIFEHAFNPLKGVLKFPEEEHTLLSTAAIKAGKRPEEWKKEELK